MNVRAQRLKLIGLCLATAVVLGKTQARADDQQLMDRIKTLEDKIAVLEGKSTQTVTQASVASATLDFLNQVNLSGFVSASYFYDFSKGTVGGANPMIAGRLFDANNNSFIPDKFKLTLEKPVDFSPTNWNVGFRADLIAGKDAELIHSTGLFGGQSFDLEQAFVKFNVPIGNGLTVLFGKHVTMMGVEVVEEVSNPNWSIGNQFMFVENTTETGVLLAYKWNDKLETDFCAINGWDQVTDVNASKSFMGRIGYTPDDKTTLSLLGYGGPEQAGDNHDWRTGTDIVFNRNKLFTDKLNVWVQLDYGHEDNAPQADLSTITPTVFPNSDWYGAGGWITYDFTDKVELALRSDYVKDKHGVRTPFVDGLGGTGNTITTPATFTIAPKEIYSETVTLNFKPINNLQIRPEVRYDRAAAGTAFNGKKDQITAGVGVAYLY
jgi:hypothetical protein